MVYLIFFFFDIIYNIFSGLTKIDFENDEREIWVLAIIRAISSLILLYFF